MKPNERQQDRAQRVGLFGGTFNPIHRGHLQVALDVRRQLDLDVVYFIPSALPPHKSTGKLAKAEHRLEMVRLTLKQQPGLDVCSLELERTGPSFSIDTVRLVKRKLSRAQLLVFLMGLDAFMEIHTWKAYDRLFEETAMAVMSRPGSGLWSPTTRQEVLDYVQARISRAYVLESDGTVLTHPQMQRIYLVSVTPVDVSSSQIRARIQAGASIDGWVAAPVARYIHQKGLYS